MTEVAPAISGADLQGRPGHPPMARPLGPRPLPDRPAAHESDRAGRPGTATPRGARPLTAARPAAATRRPVHVGVAIGMTAGLYALSLAGVTALQSATDAQLAADRAPAADAVAQLKRTHDVMERSLDRLAGAYTKAAGEYQSITDGIAGHEQSLATLQQQVNAAAAAAAALSAPSLAYPAAVSRGSSAGSSRPAAALSAPSLARLPTVSTSAASAVSRPVVNACTTASGKPC